MTRKITIHQMTSGNTTQFEVENINTLEDLKKELRNRNISYRGMDFREGISRTLLLGDSSVLPSNIPFRGEITNDLVIVLTTGKPKSGMEDTITSKYTITFKKENSEVSSFFSYNVSSSVYKDVMERLHVLYSNVSPYMDDTQKVELDPHLQNCIDNILKDFEDVDSDY